MIYSGDKLSLSSALIENKASVIEAEGDISLSMVCVLTVSLLPLWITPCKINRGQLIVNRLLP